MSTAVLLLRADSEGIALANKRLRETPAAAAEAEKAAQRLAEIQAKSSARMAEADHRFAQQRELLAQRSTSSSEAAERRFAQQREILAARSLANQAAMAQRLANQKEMLEERSAIAAERSAQRRAEAARRAAQRENDAWNDAIQRAKARDEKQEASAARSAQRRAETAERMAQRQSATAERAAQREFDSVRKSLRSEEEAVRASYEKRRAVILANTTPGRAQTTLLGRLDRQAIRDIEDAQKATDGLGSAFGRLLGPLLAVGSAAMVFHQFVTITREFDKISASLITATGSTENAAKAFKVLQQYAMETPFTLRETTKMFTQLVNMGLEPSERAMKAYGDMASALGGDLDHMMLSIGDAAMGIFRPLKQYGILAHIEGDKVKFTFRGVTESVKNNSHEIEKYLIKLSENNFAGNMARRMKTLDGAISNLGDAWDKLILSISQSGVEHAAMGWINALTDGLQAISDRVSSGEFPAYFNAIALQFQGMGDDIKLVAQEIENEFRTLGLSMKESWGGALSWMAEALRNYIPNIRMGIHLLVWETMAEFEVAWIKLKGSMKRGQDANLLPTSKFQTPTGAVPLQSREVEAQQELNDVARRTSDLVNEEVKAYDKATAAIKAQLDVARKAREEQIAQSRLPKEEGDRLARYNKRDPNQKQEKTKQELAEAKRAYNQFLQDIDAIDPLEKASRAFADRQKMIDRFEKNGSDAWEKNTELNIARYGKDVAAFYKAQHSKFESIRASLREEDELRRQYRDKQREVEKGANPAEKARLLSDLKLQENQRLAALRESRIRERQELMGYGARPEEKLRWDYDAQIRKIAAYQYRPDPSDPFSEGLSKKQLAMQARREYEHQRQQMASSRQFERADLLSNKHDEAVQLAIAEAKELQAVEDANFQRKFDTEVEHQQAIFNVRQEYARREAEMQAKYAENTLVSAEATFGSLASAAKNWRGETSSEYAALFAIQKGFAVASAGLNMAKALSEASAASPWYAKAAAMASAMADAARIVSMISSTNYSGAYDAGGYIPSGKVGLVGERRTEIVDRPTMVRGPAYVTGGSETARMMNGRGGQPIVNLRVMPTSKDTNRYRSSSRTEHVIGVTLARHPELLRLGG